MSDSPSTASRPRLDDLPDVLYIPELADFLGITDRAVRHHIERGHIKAIRLGGRIVIPRRNLEAWLAGEEVEAADVGLRLSAAR